MASYATYLTSGEFVSNGNGYWTVSQARRDANARNERAVAMGLQARYVVRLNADLRERARDRQLRDLTRLSQELEGRYS